MGTDGYCRGACPPRADGRGRAPLRRRRTCATSCTAGDRAGPLSTDEFAEALSFADAATLLLLHEQASTAASSAVPVLDDRAEVHQATGVVPVQAAVGLVEALTCSGRGAFADQRALGDLARDVLSGTVDFREVGDSG